MPMWATGPTRKAHARDGANWSLKEEVREHWSLRAATFDAQHGHRIASGTGEVTRALRAAGHRVTGVDFAEPMVARARAKHGSAAEILLADLERIPARPGWRSRLVRLALVPERGDPMQRAEHASILRRLPFADGPMARHLA